MTKTVCKFYHHGEYRVTYDDTQKINPYRVSYNWRDPRKRTKQLVRYQDIGSCMTYLAQVATSGRVLPIISK